MTNIEPSEPSRSSRDAATAAVVADTAVEPADVVTVGTFAAGQADDGRYVVAAEAPQSSFAAGQTEEQAGQTEDEPIHASTEAGSQHGE
jgi:hypothetical protein